MNVSMWEMLHVKCLIVTNNRDLCMEDAIIHELF